MFKYQTIVILLLVLGAATCFIAYLSDQLGMKLGKKRISLFGLRPRQTATALSMLSSLAVMIVTMLVLLAINPSLRKGLLYYDEAKRENARLSGLNAQLKAASQQQQSAIDMQKKTNRVLETSLQGKNVQLVGLNDRVQQTQSQVNAAQNRLSDATRNLQNAQRERESSQRARDVAQAAQNRAQSGETKARQGETKARQGETKARARFQEAQARFVKAQQQEKIARQGVVKANAELNRAKEQLSSTRLALESSRNELGASKKLTARAKQNLDVVQQRTGQILQSNTRKIAQQSKTLEEQQQALALYDQNLRIAKGILSGEIKVVVPAGQVFSAATIPARPSADEVLVVLRKLLVEAAQNAKQDNFQAINLDMTSLQTDDRESLNDEQKLTLAAQFFAAQAPISVRIVASRDHPVGETQLLVRPIGVPIRPVFASGQVIAKGSVQGGQSGAQGDAQIFNRLLALLDEGQKLATARGIAAIPTAEEPNFYASDTRLIIFQALRQIQQKTGDVPVRVVAASAISTVDAVRIRIEVGAQEVGEQIAVANSNRYVRKTG